MPTLTRRKALKLNRLRKHYGGPPKKLSPCPLCKASFGSRDMRIHKPKCRKKHGITYRVKRKKAV